MRPRAPASLQLWQDLRLTLWTHLREGLSSKQEMCRIPGVFGIETPKNMCRPRLVSRSISYLALARIVGVSSRIYSGWTALFRFSSAHTCRKACSCAPQTVKPKVGSEPWLEPLRLYYTWCSLAYYLLLAFLPCLVSKDSNIVQCIGGYCIRDEPATSNGVICRVRFYLWGSCSCSCPKSSCNIL